MVLSRETCKDYGFMSSFPPRNKDGVGLRDVHQNPVMCLPDRQVVSKRANMKNPANVDNPPHELKKMNAQGYDQRARKRR